MNEIFEKDATYIKGVGPKRATLLKKLGITSLGSLVNFFPRDYEAWDPNTTLSQKLINTVCCIKATVVSDFLEYKVRNNLSLHKCVVRSSFQKVHITFFNNPYVASKLQKNKVFLFYGRVTFDGIKYEMISPQFSNDLCKVLKPVYNQTEGLSSNQISTCIKNALELLNENIESPLPNYLIKKLDLCPYIFALKNIHFPASQKELLRAKKALAFSELLILKLGLSFLKNERKIKKHLQLKTNYSEEFYGLLPFSPTKAQKRAISSCFCDMSKNSYPMSRLLQGDVGSGKTVVAAATCYNTAKNNAQAAFMVPTEILAIQHYNWFNKIFTNTSLNIAILTGSTKLSDKRKIKQNLELGIIDIVIGTHALLTSDVKFENLGLAITDEQHRFGVLQRLELSKKGDNPNVLIMSATPIPRTLSFMIYGDLNVSILDELPPGRKKVDTFYIDSSKRARMFGFLKKLIKDGRQGYIVCPLVEESNNNLASVEEYAKYIKQSELKEFNIKIIHGKMKSHEKDDIMNSFFNGDVDILISTTVIEVGVDVKNAAFIVIENAERFGLSQLHQLRGRVGRGKFKSYCIMVSNAQNKEANKRFRIMKESSDGFKIADEDLKIRGPGDFFGSRQHGLPNLKIANILNDSELLFKANEEAEHILDKDPLLLNDEHKCLKIEIKKLFENMEI